MMRKVWGRSGARGSMIGVFLLLSGVVATFALPAVSAADSTFRVRVLNAVADNTGMDVWIDDQQLAANAPFKALNPYTARKPGNYELRVFPPGKTARSSAWVVLGIKFEAPKDYTIVVHGKQSDNTLEATIEIDRNTQDASNARIRFGNDIIGAGQATLAISGSNTVLGTAKVGETDEYTTVAPGSYTIFANDANANLITKTTLTLGANTVVSVFLLGTPSGSPGPLFVTNVDTGTAPAQVTAAPTAAPSAPSAPVTNIVPAATPVSSAAVPNDANLRQALQAVPSTPNTATKVWFGATNHTLGGGFKAYWEAHGGLSQFGYPLTEEYQGVSPSDGQIRTIQYFERARFEYHPENKGTEYEVQAGLLGRELLRFLGAL